MNTTHGLAAHPALPSVAARSLGILGVALSLAACSTEPSSRVVSAPPPPAPVTQTVVVPAETPTTTVSTPDRQTIIVQTQPPALQAESPPPRPSSDYVWVPGYWAWQNNRYVWVAGRWTIPPRVGATWVPPRWEPEGRGFRYYDGYWD
jgi:hypothetical protein